MNRVKEKIQMAQTKAYLGMLNARAALRGEEPGDHLLEGLGTIIIAIVVLVIFKDSIVNIFNNAIGETATQMDGLFNGGITE